MRGGGTSWQRKRKKLRESQGKGFTAEKKRNQESCGQFSLAHETINFCTNSNLGREISFGNLVEMTPETSSNLSLHLPTSFLVHVQRANESTAAVFFVRFPCSSSVRRLHQVLFWTNLIVPPFVTRWSKHLQFSFVLCCCHRFVFHALSWFLLLIPFKADFIRIGYEAARCFCMFKNYRTLCGRW